MCPKDTKRNPSFACSKKIERDREQKRKRGNARIEDLIGLGSLRRRAGVRGGSQRKPFRRSGKRIGRMKEGNKWTDSKKRRRRKRKKNATFPSGDFPYHAPVFHYDGKPPPLPRLPAVHVLVTCPSWSWSFVHGGIRAL